MTADPLVTIVIPTWNRLRLVQEAVASVIAQTYSRWELVIVDDGSTDGTPDRLRSLGDDRIRVLVCSHAGNVGRLRNLGAAAGSGELIAFLDSDDVWLPRKLELQVGALRHSTAGWCYTRFELMDSQGCAVAMRAGEFQPLSGNIIRELLTTTACVAMPTLIVRRALFDAVGRFSEEPRLREDFDLYLRLAVEFHAIAISELLVCVRDHPERRTASFGDPHERSALAYERFLERNADPELAALARRVWARHLANAGADRLAAGEFRRAGYLLRRALKNGAGPGHCSRALARRIKDGLQSRVT